MPQRQWALVTMASVGYGDMIPTTTIGKIVGSLTIVFGVMMLALPISILTQNFADHDDHDEEIIYEILHNRRLRDKWNSQLAKE